MLEVVFYVLSSSSAQERNIFTCKLAEKIYRSGQRCYILTQEDNQTRVLDDLLWTFRPGSFIPHQSYNGNGANPDNKILLGSADAPGQWQNIIINLSSGCPAGLDNCQKILEIIDNNEKIKSEARKRYKTYQVMNTNITTHQISSN